MTPRTNRRTLRDQLQLIDLQRYDMLIKSARALADENVEDKEVCRIPGGTAKPNAWGQCNRG